MQSLLKKNKQTHTYQIQKNTKSYALVSQFVSCASLTCHVQGAFLGGGDGAVPAAQQWTAPALAHLLLQPGTQLQVGLRG